MTIPKIIKVETQPTYKLIVRWADGSMSQHDLADIIRTKKWAKPLADPAIFAGAIVELQGDEVAWPSTDIEFSAEGLWDETHPVPSQKPAQWMTASQFSHWLTEMGFTRVKAAKALGVVRRTIGNYVDGTTDIPKTVWLACMKLASENRRAKKAHKSVAFPGFVRTSPGATGSSSFNIFDATHRPPAQTTRLDVEQYATAG